MTSIKFLSVFAFLIILSVLTEAYKAPTDIQTQLKLKKRAQGCMRRILPATPMAKGYQNQLASCFKVDCAMALIPQVQRNFPREFPILKGCMGY